MKKLLKIVGTILASLAGLYVVASIGFYFWAKNEVDYEFKDISHESTYSSHIGNTYVTTKDVHIVKIEQDNGPFNGKQLIYSVMENRIEDSSFLLNEVLPKNTTLILEKVVRSKASANNEAVLIRISSTDKYSDAPVYFDHKELMVRNDYTAANN